MKTNIPIYRAKKMRSDEYIMGLVSEAMQLESNTIVWIRNKDEVCDIDPSTLSIHFPDMLDSDGNEIFASLSKDGKGGDIVESLLKDDIVFKIMFDYQRGIFMTLVDNFRPYSVDYNRIKVTGIQE